MAINSFINTADSVGIINEIPTDLSASVTIQDVDGLTMTKTADQLSWAGGILTFRTRLHKGAKRLSRVAV